MLIRWIQSSDPSTASTRIARIQSGASYITTSVLVLMILDHITTQISRIKYALITLIILAAEHKMMHSSHLTQDLIAQTISKELIILELM